MRINGWWLALGLMSFSDFILFHINFGYEYTWIQIMNIILVFIGFGLTFRKDAYGGLDENE